MEKLKDIKDIVEVPDNSIFVFIGLIAIILITISFGIYLFKNREKRRKKISPKEIALKRLKELNFLDTKSVVYRFEEFGRLFLDDKNREEFDLISKELIVYKYKRDIPTLDSRVEERIKRFIGELKC